MTGWFVCVGDLMVDVVARVPGPLAVGSDTPGLISMRGGGAAANVATWLASQMDRVCFVGCVGDDAAGREAVDGLVRAGVSPRVAIDPELSTGTCITLVTPDGERTMVPDAGANRGLGAHPVDALLPEDLGALYLSGYALFNPDSRPFAVAAAMRARNEGWYLAVDAASAAPLEAAGIGRFADWVGEDVVLFANTDEARVLLGETVAPREAAVLLARRFGQAVVKAGPDGACWSDGRRSHTVPALPAVVVDTIGAGDAFAAGFLAQLGRPRAGLVLGARLAARAVSQAGARPAVPARS